MKREKVYFGPRFQSMVACPHCFGFTIATYSTCLRKPVYIMVAGKQREKERRNSPQSQYPLQDHLLPKVPTF
jgi:hypothetical protein